MKILLLLLLLVSLAYSEDLTVEGIVQNLINGDYSHGVAKVQDDDIFRFIVFGDFGLIPNYFEIGKTAEVMNKLAQVKHYEYMITVGDNFYPNGVPYLWFRFMPWLAMSQFKRSAIKNTLVYPTLGNHDCYGNVNNSIAFSDYDSQWTLEQDYYVMKQQMKDDPSKYFVNLMLNSCKLFCPTAEFQDLNSECADMHIEPESEEVSVHYRWVKEQLEKYSQDPSVAWLAITMHHPAFLEQGEKKYLLPLLRQYKVDIMLVGHDHWLEYANMDHEYKVRFPFTRRGPVIDDCKNKKEIMKTTSREVTFRKGERVHQFLVGSGGADLDSLCPYEDQDGDVYWRNIEGYGVMTVEMNSKKFTATYVIEGQKEVYKINLVA